MNNSGMPVQWTEQQWDQIQQTIYEGARKARVAGRFLPLFGPLPADSETVPKKLLGLQDQHQAFRPPDKRLHVDDVNVLPIIRIAVDIYLRTTQQSQPDLGSALTMFSRAANIIARVEDAIVFRGGEYHSVVSQSMLDAVTVTGLSATNNKGLYDYAANTVPIPPPATGQKLVQAVAQGISKLEELGHGPPYALALGDELFVVAQTPEASSMVLPSDRILPLIEGPLVRSSTLPSKPSEFGGILVSLAGNPVEIVVAKDISAHFIQVSPEPRFIYRVSERFVLRVKEPDAIVALTAGGTKHVKTVPTPKES